MPMEAAAATGEGTARQNRLGEYGPAAGRHDGAHDPLYCGARSRSGPREGAGPLASGSRLEGFSARKHPFSPGHKGGRR
jgi:hypothetical protein